MQTLALLITMLAQDRVNQGALITQEFQKRVADYVTLEKNLAKDLGSNKPTEQPQAILEHQHALASKIREARKSAVQGAIFTPEISKEFRRLLGFATEGTNDARIKKSLERSEPVRLNLHVNESYPANTPLQSTPATILMNLPRLPPELEYRITGHALVLRDANANIVVDLMPDAIP